jgi:signal transduction histidine kinase
MSLFLRLVLLCALVAILAVSVSALAAMRAVSTALDAQEEIIGDRAASQFLRHLDAQLAILVFEVKDYAAWDEMYSNSPRPPVPWARINLIPGADAGRLTQVLAIVDQGKVTGRYTHRGQRGEASHADDRADPGALIGLAGRSETSGLAWLNGAPALWARADILRSDGSGPPRGQLIALSYLNSRVVERLAIHGWSWRLLGPEDDGSATRSGEAVQRVALPPANEGLVALLSRPREVETQLRSRTLTALAVAGGGVAAIALLIGVLLGWHWLRPLHDLASACRQRAHGIDAAIPDGGDLPETRVLAADLRRLIEIERADRRRLAAELAEAESSNTQQRRWLVRLAHDVGSPVQVIAAAVRQLEERGGLLPPEELARLGTATAQLMGRVEEASGLVEGLGGERPSSGTTSLSAYTSAVIDLLRARAAERQVRIDSEVSGEADIDASLITPVLVNLLANAITASPVAGHVTLRGGTTDAAVWFEVDDSGTGMDAVQRSRISRACNRGEVIPGEAGFGLGLTLAIANTTRAGGRLCLSDAPATSFRLELPVQQRAK